MTIRLGSNYHFFFDNFDNWSSRPKFQIFQKLSNETSLYVLCVYIRRINIPRSHSNCIRTTTNKVKKKKRVENHKSTNVEGPLGSVASIATLVGKILLISLIYEANALNQSSTLKKYLILVNCIIKGIELLSSQFY